MKVMRFANNRGHSGLYNYALDKKNPKQLDMNSMIPACNLKSHGQYENDFQNGEFGNNINCQMFQPVVTDLGMCHAFNPMPTLDMLRPSYFTESFNEAFNEDLIFDKNLFMAKGSGEDYAFNFYLMGDSSRKETAKAPIRFNMELSTNNNYFGMKSTGQGIKAGYHTTWKVQAMEINPSKHLRNVPMVRRKCRFEDETKGLKLFKIYSQAACQFEYKIMKAKEFCQCLPWHIPSDSKSKRHTICDLFGNYCFKRMMKNQTRNTDCLPLCHQIQYTYSEVIEKINSEDACNPFLKSSFEKSIALELFPSKFINKYATIKRWHNPEFKNKTDLKYNEKEVWFKFCKNMVEKDLAKVTIFFEKDTYVRTLTNLKSTFTDKLGVFGMCIISPRLFFISQGPKKLKCLECGAELSLNIRNIKFFC